MKEKYYGFNGQKLVYIGEFEDIDDALDFEMKHHPTTFFYVTSANEWKKVLEEMNKSIQHEFQ